MSYCMSSGVNCLALPISKPRINTKEAILLTKETLGSIDMDHDPFSQ